MASEMRKDLVFPVAGHFMFVPYGTDNQPDMSRAYSSNKGVVVSIARDMTLNTTTLPDGNSPYPAAEYVTTQEGTLTITLSTYDPQLEALLSGANFQDGDSTADKTMWFMGSVSVPETTAYSVTLEPKPISADTLLIEDMYGNKFKPAETSPSAKLEYTYDSSAGTVTFNAADAGKILTVIYQYTADSVTAVGYLENPKKSTFMAVIVGESKDKDEVTFQKTNVIIDRCTANGAVTPPTSSNDPTQGWTVTVSVLKPRAGKAPVSVKFENEA